MATINYKNLSWWYNQWKNASIAKPIADKFVTKLKSDIEFFHDSHDCVSSSISLSYTLNEDEKIFVNLSLDEKSGYLIFPKKIGEILKITPITRTYGDCYELRFDDLDVMAQKIDDVWESIFKPLLLVDKIKETEKQLNEMKEEYETSIKSYIDKYVDLNDVQSLEQAMYILPESKAKLVVYDALYDLQEKNKKDEK